MAEPATHAFNRRDFTGYTDNQAKYLRIGWNAAVRALNHQRQVREDSQGLGEPGRLSPSTVGVPAFDPTQPCALEPGGNPLATMCPRCKNPHHKCDRNAGVKGSNNG